MARRVNCKGCGREFRASFPTTHGATFRETCPECGVSHHYTRSDYRMPRHAGREERATQTKRKRGRLEGD